MHRCCAMERVELLSYEYYRYYVTMRKLCLKRAWYEFSIGISKKESQPWNSQRKAGGPAVSTGYSTFSVRYSGTPPFSRKEHHRFEGELGFGRNGFFSQEFPLQWCDVVPRPPVLLLGTDRLGLLDLPTGVYMELSF